MNKDQSIPTILWAIDPFASEAKLQKQAARLIKTLETKKSFQIQPVYVVAFPFDNETLARRKDIEETLQKNIQEKVKTILTGTHLKEVLPTQILKSSDKSVREHVKIMLDYAKGIHAEMIVVSTRAKNGPSRLFLGSFVESLSMKSDIPLLITNPSFKKKPAFKDILFPTDFSEESLKAFKKVLPLAKQMGCQVHIYHKYVYELANVWTYAFVIAPLYLDPETEKAEIKNLEKEGKKWEKIAHEFGVQAISEIETEGSYSILEAILNKCKTGHYLIAMSTRSGPVEANLLGSVARQVMRHSLSPIWIVHPEEVNQAALKPKNKPQNLEQIA